MTDGIVSAINRDLTVNDRTMSLIQTNAALNNGNSGGPLINCYGQVIGINTMKMSNFYSSSTTVEGIGFAIPIDTAKPIIIELIEKGYVSGRPAIGIDGETLPATYRIYYRLPQGIYVTRVYRNSDAAAKGISEGDIITAINGVSVTTMEQLTASRTSSPPARPSHSPSTTAAFPPTWRLFSWTAQTHNSAKYAHGAPSAVGVTLCRRSIIFLFCTGFLRQV